MNDIAVTLDEETAEWARLHAAKCNVNVSQFLGDILHAEMLRSCNRDEAMRRFFAVTPRNLNDGKPYPLRDQLYDRKVLR